MGMNGDKEDGRNNADITLEGKYLRNGRDIMELSEMPKPALKEVKI